MNCSEAFLFPVHIGHVSRKLTVEPMFGPVAVGLAAYATRVEPFRMSLEVFVVLMNVIYDEIHHHAIPASWAASTIACNSRACPGVVRRPCFGWPVPVEGSDVVHAIRSLARAVGCGVERR